MTLTQDSCFCLKLWCSLHLIIDLYQKIFFLVLAFLGQRSTKLSIAEKGLESRGLPTCEVYKTYTDTALVVLLSVRGPVCWQRVGNSWVCPCSSCGPGCFLTSVAQTVKRLMWQLVCDESCKCLQRLPG